MVLLPFGVSFGNFVAFVKLCKDVAQALHESTGAQSQFHRAIADLEGIETDAALLIASACHVHLNIFLPRIEKYRPHLQKLAGSQAHNGGKLNGIWSKIKWALCHFEDEIANLKASLAPLLMSIGVLLQIDAGVRSARSEQEVAQVLQIVKDAVPQIEDMSLFLRNTITTEQFDRLQIEFGRGMQSVLQQFSHAATGTQIRNLDHKTDSISAQLTELQNAMTAQVQKLESLTQTCTNVQEINRAQNSASTLRQGELCLRLNHKMERVDPRMAVTSDNHSSTTTGLPSDPPKALDSQSTSSGIMINSKTQSVLRSIGSLGALVAILYAFLLLIIQAKLRTCVTIMKSPRLLSGDNITLTDALNCTKTLAYEYFRSWSILQPWLRREFESLPGEVRMARGDFAVFKQFSNKFSAEIYPMAWERSVFPGDRVVMSIHIIRFEGTRWDCGRCGARLPTTMPYTRREAIKHGKHGIPECGLNVLAQEPWIFSCVTVPSLGQDEPLGPQVAQHILASTPSSLSQDGGDDKFARVHFVEDFPCFFCPLIFASGVLRRRHSRWHGPKDSICPECGAAFFDGKSFTRHEKVHKLSRDYFCGVGGCPCEQPGFSWKDHLTRQG
ncbi:hypothetical protein Q7P36_009359 [Cladosporium allicinum]